MEAFVDFFVQWGYLGLFLGSFLAGSLVPFSSEALLVVCVGPLDLNPLWCLVVAVLGNVSGGMTCYWFGHLGNMEWIKRYTHVKEDQLEKAKRWVQGSWGAWISFFVFIPLLGTAIIVALGYLRANLPITFIGMTTGKILRYAAIIWGVERIGTFI